MDKKEYDVLKGLLSGEQKHTLSRDILVPCVQAKTLEMLGACSRVYVLHDFCDIRKPHSSSMENLGKVRSLEKTLVNGYSTFNSVVIDPTVQGVHLLNHVVFSNTMENFVTQEEVHQIVKSGALAQEAAQNGTLSAEKSVIVYGKSKKEISVATQELVANQTYINHVTLAKQEITAASEVLKKEHPTRTVAHVLDREFDNEAIFSLADSLQDEFVIRLKNTRLSNVRKEVKTKKGKVSKKINYKKLTDIHFKNAGSYGIEKLTLDNKTYEKVTANIEFDTLKLDKKTYSVVRVILMHNGKPLFAEPMLLITNRAVKTLEEARAVYSTYLLRFKIELVFRFLKQNLGWETFQVRDFNTIANLLAVAFFLVGYFKELEEQLKTHPLAEFLCKLALSKGKITIHFLLEGLQKVVHHQEVSIWMQENNISQQQLNELLETIKNQ